MRLYDGDPRRVATILPGRGYTPDRPLLHFTRRALTDRGWSVRELWWQNGARTTDEQAAAEAEQVIAEVGDVDLHLVVGKSLGSYGIPVAVERALPGVWFTPLLRAESVRAAVQNILEPSLLLGGTGDGTWDEDVARESRAQVHEVRDADHSLEVPGSVRDSVKALDKVMRRVEDFIDGLER